MVDKCLYAMFAVLAIVRLKLRFCEMSYDPKIRTVYASDACDSIALLALFYTLTAPAKRSSEDAAKLKRWTVARRFSRR